MDTKQAIAALNAIAGSLGDEFRPAVSCECSDMLKAGVAALLYRDLIEAMEAAGEKTYQVAMPKRWELTSGWRDYHGWECADERTARFVAAWCKRYTSTHAGGDEKPGTYVEQRGEAWIAVTAVWKVED